MHNSSNRHKVLPPNAPKFLIIGVQKAGTTTLFDMLSDTSVTKGSSEKEVHFFDRDSAYQSGLGWYLNYFKAANGKMTFEASPSYIYSQRAPRRIYETLGSVKFIMIMRDPVKRCFAAWNMFRNFNKDKRIAQNINETFIKHSNVEHRQYMHELLFAEKFPGFEECVSRDILRYETCSSIEEPSFVRRGLYYEQIVRYLDYFSIQDFLFLEQSELTINVDETLSKIQRLLGLKDKPLISGSRAAVNSNKGYYDDIVVEEYKQVFLTLYSFYQEHNAKLFGLIGKACPWISGWMAK